MQAVACPACGRSNSEFDSHCASCGAPLPLPSSQDLTRVEGPSDDPLIGQKVSHFRIQRLLGRGGMGVVYQAVDLELGRVAALKFLHPQARRAQDEARFLREAQATATLDHPNIGTIYEIGERDGRRFIAMAYYEGETLASRLQGAPEGRLPIPEATAITGQLASALAAAHDAGVVHRDLKPDNVMLLRDGRVKLLDFGLAKWEDATSVTGQGFAVGTAAYMAPEQFRGETGAPADLWALGVVLHQMLAGERPFGGERKGMVHAIFHEDPPSLRKVRPDVPEALERIVARCLEKDPAARYPHPAALLADLAAAGLWESGSSGTGFTIPLAPSPRAWRRWLLLAAAVLLAAGAAAFLLLRKPRAPVYVAVIKPAVTGSLLADDQAQVGANLQAALVRAVAALEGLAVLDTAQVNAIHGTPREISRAVAAGETVTSLADCAGDFCQVTLSRLGGTDGRVLWSSALRLPVSDPLLFANAVAASLRQGYAGRALRVPRLELEIQPRDYRAFLDLRQRLADPTTYGELLDRLGELRQRAPSFLDAQVLEAKVAWRLYLDSGEERYLERGLAVARQAHELAPDDPRPLDTLFSLNLDSGRLAEAGTLLEEMEEVDPAGSLLRRGQLAERQGHIEEALKLMADAARLQPSWKTLLTVANAEYRQGRLDEARRHLEELLERSPGNLEGLKTLAQIELLRDPERAISLLREAVKSDPETGSLTNLGVNLLLLRRYGEAEASLRQALARQPDDPSAALNLADCLTLLGRTKEAAKLYAGIVDTATRRATPGDWSMLAIKAQALAHLGQTGPALDTIQQALRLTPDNGQLAYEAAVVYAVVGDRGSALFHAKQAAERKVDAQWFTLPFFDSLRSEPGFLDLTGKKPG